MTNIGSLVLILVCVGIGYILEPIFFSGAESPSTKPAPVEEVEDDETADSDDSEVVPAPDSDAEDVEVQIDLSKVTEADFPAKVTLKKPCTLSDEDSGVTMQLKAGVKVKPIRLEGDQLVFQPVGLPIEGKIEISNTDFKELAAPLMLQRVQEEMDSGDSDSTMDSEPEPDPIPVPELDPMPDPEVEPEPAEDPEPAPKSDTPKVGGGDAVSLMKASVAADDVTEFEVAQVVSWKAGKPIKFDGKVYQTGLVTFKAETILGMQEHDAIALISKGAVVKWMWAKTKLEMR